MLVFVLCIQVVVQVMSEMPPASPQNIHVDNWLLTWTPVTEEGNVTYTVQYSSFGTGGWKDVSACAQITFKSCNVTFTKAEGEHGCVKLRVLAERRGLRSNAVQACSRQQEDSCTPKVNLTARPGSLTIHLSRNHSLALEHGEHAKHRIYFGKDGEPLKKFIDATSSVSIHDLQERQRYCTKVQYIYFNKSIGLASCTLCEVIPESRKDPKRTETIVAVVVVVMLGILISLIAYFLIFQRGRIKQWLQPPYQIPEDFIFEPFPEHHNPISPSSPSEEHLDVISCIIPNFRE